MSNKNLEQISKTMVWLSPDDLKRASCTSNALRAILDGQEYYTLFCEYSDDLWEKSKAKYPVIGYVVEYRGEDSRDQFRHVMWFLNEKSAQDYIERSRDCFGKKNGHLMHLMPIQEYLKK